MTCWNAGRSVAGRVFTAGFQGEWLAGGSVNQSVGATAPD